MSDRAEMPGFIVVLCGVVLMTVLLMGVFFAFTPTAYILDAQGLTGWRAGAGRARAAVAGGPSFLADRCRVFHPTGALLTKSPVPGQRQR